MSAENDLREAMISALEDAEVLYSEAPLGRAPSRSEAEKLTDIIIALLADWRKAGPGEEGFEK